MGFQTSNPVFVHKIRKFKFSAIDLVMKIKPVEFSLDLNVFETLKSKGKISY